MALEQYVNKENYMMKTTLITLITICALSNGAIIKEAFADTECKKADLIVNSSGDMKFGQILNPPKGTDYAVWFPIVPTALAIDSKGNIYVGDSVKYRVLKYNKNGKFILKYSLQKPTRTKKPELSHIIQDMSLDLSDNLYVINLYEYRVEIYNAEGKFVRNIDYYNDAVSQPKPQKRYQPYKISVDKKGNVYLYGHNMNMIYSSNGQLKNKTDRKSAINNKDDMVGYSGFEYDINSYAPNPKLPGKIMDVIVIKDKNKNIIKKCDKLDIEVAFDDAGKIYKTDNYGNIYTFDYYDTLNVIKIFTNLK